MLFDTHCHLDFDAFDADREAVWARANQVGVTHCLIPAIDRQNSAAILRLAEQFEGVYCAVGIHPNSSADFSPVEDIALLRHLAQHPKVVAIGEIGLDYHWDRAPRQQQFAAFRAQLHLATELGLPVIIHNREASADCLRLLTESEQRRGVLHSFSADEQSAETALQLGFHLGFTGPLTYKNAETTRRVATLTPLNRLLIETDAPFLTPMPHRGQRNEPAYVALVNQRLATLRQRTDTEMAHITTTNALTLFFAGKTPLTAR